MNFWYYFILYLFYSMCGWLIEVIDTLINEKKFVNRGFLIGPYCPIYGKGALLVIWLLEDYLERPIGLFVMSMVICSIIEYLGSVILEKLFNTRWWDYSHKKFNINGRICLENIIPFGFACLLLMYIVNPFISKLLLAIPKTILMIVGIILLICYLIDFCISFNIIWHFKNLSKDIRKDSTEKVTEYVRKEILKKNKALYTRLITAFPRLKIVKILKEQKEKLKQKKSKY